MNTRRKRFFAALAHCQASSPEAVNPAIAKWDFRKADHPADEYPMALADTNLSLHGDFDRGPHRPPFVHGAEFFLSAVRTGATASTIETSAGITINLIGLHSDMRNVILDDQGVTGLVYCLPNEAPAYQNTTRMRVKWLLDSGTVEPNVVLFRGVPRLMHAAEHAIFLEMQMPANWDEPPNVPVIESVFSKWATTPASGDKVAITIPWIHGEHELVGVLDVANLTAALVQVKALVTPPATGE